ncbi:MAG: N-acetylmuramoyl-L-alanine amidase [Lachnospiraceae bacterium]
MQTGLRIQTLIYALLFCVLSMCGMLFFARNKAIEISNVAQDQVVAEDSLTVGEQEESGSLRFRQEEVKNGYLCIPLASGVKAENVMVENHYMERQIWIYIKDTSPGFYAKEAISGNLTGITEGNYEYAGGTTLIKFTLSDVYECKSILEEGKLYIDFVPPGEIYEKIVVIDAGGGGSENGATVGTMLEKDINLDILKRLKVLLDAGDIKVYYTRTGDKEVLVQDRIALANSTNADMFISIQVNESEDVTLYGTEVFYNGQYFTPDFNSVKLADLAERNVVTRISTRGNGLFAAEEKDTLLQAATVPAVVIKVGYASHPQEAELLQSEAYREKIAQGLYDAILAAYEEQN